MFRTAVSRESVVGRDDRGEGCDSLCVMCDVLECAGKVSQFGPTVCDENRVLRGDIIV